jgi:hypothetical protein
MCFLLAVRAIASGLTKREKSELLSQLDTTQRAMCEAALDVLEGSESRLREVLGIPQDEQAWPDPVSIHDDEVEKSLGAFEHLDGDQTSVLVKYVPPPTTRPTFRVIHRRKTPGYIGLGVGVMIAIAVRGGVGSSFITMMGCAGVGAIIGHKLVRYTCADPVCNATISKHDQILPRLFSQDCWHPHRR